MTIALLATARAAAARRQLLHKRCYVPTLTERREGEAGKGGRMTEAGLRVAIFGAGGFVGRYLCAHLGANGFRVYLGNRGDDHEMRDLKTQFDLGRTRMVFYSPRDIESVKEVIADADVVVNLIGKYYETGQPVTKSSFPYLGYQTNYSFYDANVTIPQTLAAVCKELQVDHFIHVSALSSNPDSKSEWSRTKYQGELAVKEAYPWATIIRPSHIFGKDDRFLNWFGRTQQFLMCRPLLYQSALTQPVFVDDVAKTIFRVIDSQLTEPTTIDCYGPDDFTYAELSNFCNDITQQNKPILELPIDIARPLSQVMQYSRNPLLTPDLVEQMTEDCVPTGQNATMQDFGVTPTPMEKVAFGFMHHYRAGGHFFRHEGYHSTL